MTALAPKPKQPVNGYLGCATKATDQWPRSKGNKSLPWLRSQGAPANGCISCAAKAPKPMAASAPKPKQSVNGCHCYTTKATN